MNLDSNKFKRSNFSFKLRNSEFEKNVLETKFKLRNNSWKTEIIDFKSRFKKIKTRLSESNQYFKKYLKRLFLKIVLIVSKILLKRKSLKELKNKVLNLSQKLKNEVLNLSQKLKNKVLNLPQKLKNKVLNLSQKLKSETKEKFLLWCNKQYFRDLILALQNWNFSEDRIEEWLVLFQEFCKYEDLRLTKWHLILLHTYPINCFEESLILKTSYKMKYLYEAQKQSDIQRKYLPDKDLDLKEFINILSEELVVKNFISSMLLVVLMPTLTYISLDSNYNIANFDNDHHVHHYLFDQHGNEVINSNNNQLVDNHQQDSYSKNSDNHQQDSYFKIFWKNFFIYKTFLWKKKPIALILTFWMLFSFKKYFWNPNDLKSAKFLKDIYKEPKHLKALQNSNIYDKNHQKLSFDNFLLENNFPFIRDDIEIPIAKKSNYWFSKKNPFNKKTSLTEIEKQKTEKGSDLNLIFSLMSHKNKIAISQLDDIHHEKKYIFLKNNFFTNANELTVKKANKGFGFDSFNLHDLSKKISSNDIEYDTINSQVETRNNYIVVENLSYLMNFIGLCSDWTVDRFEHFWTNTPIPVVNKSKLEFRHIKQTDDQIVKIEQALVKKSSFKKVYDSSKDFVLISMITIGGLFSMILFLTVFQIWSIKNKNQEKFFFGIISVATLMILILVILSLN